MSGRIFGGGVPTEPDVRVLLEQYGRPEQGRRIPYGEVEVLIKVRRPEKRFTTVTNAWRREIYKLYNLLIGCESGKGFIVLPEPDRLASGVGGFKAAMRKMRRNHDVIVGCDDEKLNEPQRLTKAHSSRVMGHLLMAERQEARRKQLPSSTVPAVSPQVAS